MTAASNAIIDQEDRRCHDPQLLSGGEPGGGRRPDRPAP